MVISSIYLSKHGKCLLTVTSRQDISPFFFQFLHRLAWKEPMLMYVHYNIWTEWTDMDWYVGWLLDWFVGAMFSVLVGNYIVLLGCMFLVWLFVRELTCFVQKEMLSTLPVKFPRSISFLTENASVLGSTRRMVSKSLETARKKALAKLELGKSLG